MKTYTFVHKDTGAFVSIKANNYPHALDLLGLIVKDIFQFKERQDTTEQVSREYSNVF